MKLGNVQMSKVTSLLIKCQQLQSKVLKGRGNITIKDQEIEIWRWIKKCE